MSISTPRIQSIPSITNRESISMKRYLHDVTREDMIGDSEVAELAMQIHQGSVEARNKLVNANLRFAISVAKQFQNQGLPLEDLIQEANRGLIKAAERYDETRGARFTTYAVNWILQSIMAALSKKARTIRLPQNQVAFLSLLRRTSAEFMHKNGCEPTYEELSEILDVPVEDVAGAFAADRHVASLNAPMGEDGDGCMLDMLEDGDAPRPDATLIAESLKQDMQDALTDLSPREQCIVRMYFGIDRKHPLPLDEIASEVRLSRERVRQILNKSLRRMAKGAHGKKLKGYL